jgi:hypothetical protein
MANGWRNLRNCRRKERREDESVALKDNLHATKNGDKRGTRRRNDTQAARTGEDAAASASVAYGGGSEGTKRHRDKRPVPPP